MEGLTPQETKFRRDVRKWQRKLNLMDWRISHHSGASEGVIAEVAPSVPDHHASVYVNSDELDDGPEAELNINEAACHECLHILTSELITAVQAAAMTGEEELVAATEHRLINTLVPLLARRRRP